MRRELHALWIATVLHAVALRIASGSSERNPLLDRRSEPSALVWVDLDGEPTLGADPIRTSIDPPPEVAQPPEDPLEKPAAARLPAPPEEPLRRSVIPTSEAPVAALSKPESARLAPDPSSGNAPTTDEPQPPGALADPAVGASPLTATGPTASNDDYSEGVSPSEALGLSSVGGLSLPRGPGLPEDVAASVAIGASAAARAPTEAPTAPGVDVESANRVLGSTMMGRDRAVGIDLPATQIVVGVVAESVRQAPLPHNTRASVAVDLGPGGVVRSVRVTSSSQGETSTWEAASARVTAALSGRSLDLGSASASGATIVVGVTVKHVYPTGSSRAAEIKPICANQILNDLADAIDDTAPKEDGAKPGAEPGGIPLLQDERGRPCIPVGVSGTADAANLGAKKQLQVQTSSKVLIDGKEALPSSLPTINRDPLWFDSGKGGPRPVMPFKARKYKRDKEKRR